MALGGWLLALACDGIPTEPTVYAQTLPIVTLTLEAPNVARVKADSRDTIICISAPDEWFLGMAPGAVHTVCRSAGGWLKSTGPGQ